MAATATLAPVEDPIMARLDDQIGWYNKKSTSYQRTFKRIKVVEIVSAALIPFVTALPVVYLKFVASVLGVLVTVLEGVLHLYQYQQNWITYRATCEALTHEKFLYIAGAGPYADIPNARAVLAERMESLMAQENTKWAAVQQQPAQKKES